jgi:hypothetical protein
MSTKDRPAQESAGTYDEPPRLLPKHVYLGVDTEGYRHHLDRDANVITRFTDAGEIERRTELDSRHLDEYLLFVAEDVGWRVRKQAGSFDFFPEAR